MYMYQVTFNKSCKALNHVCLSSLSLLIAAYNDTSNKQQTHDAWINTDIAVRVNGVLIPNVVAAARNVLCSPTIITGTFASLKLATLQHNNCQLLLSADNVVCVSKSAIKSDGKSTTLPPPSHAHPCFRPSVQLIKWEMISRCHCKLASSTEYY